MLSDDEIKLKGRSAFGIDPTFDGHLMRFARAVERAAYERAAQECEPHDDDDSIDRQIKRELAERILALGRQ